MSHAISKLRKQVCMCAAVVAVCSLTVMAAPPTATARPYTVVSCDAAGLFGYSSAAWAPFGNAGSAYEACPTGGGSTAGVSNRLIGTTYSGFNHSGHAFTAPPGATITSVRWSGRMARDNCRWGTWVRAIPSGASIMGLPHGQYCDSSAFDNRGWPLSFGAPEGTTTVEQLVFCGAAQCLPGATIHAHVLEVTVDDPIPPSISLDGPLASGGWVSGLVGRARVDISVMDNSGLRKIEAAVGDRSEAEEHACDWTRAQPCPADIRTSLAPTISDLADGLHTLTVSTVDAAANLSAVSREVRVDNTPPDPVAPQVAHGDAWRASNQFLVSWTNPSPNWAPIVRAHWKLC